MTVLHPALNEIPAWESSALKRWTVQDYHRMSEAGILGSEERTELIAGHILLMAAKGVPHVLVLRLLKDALERQLGDQPVLVITQDPIQLDDFSEPEPDLAIAYGNALDYAEHHPRPRDIALIVEVADSTLKRDCEVKDKLYAVAGIGDYWVLDLPNRRLHVFREPTPAGYTRHLSLTAPNSISPLAFPDVAIALSSMFPSRL